MSWKHQHFIHDLNITYLDCFGLSPEELEAMYKVSNPREKRFITAFKNRKQPAKESPAQFRAKNINRAIGSLSYAKHGISGMGRAMESYMRCLSGDQNREAIKINMAAITLRDLEVELSLRIKELKSIQAYAAIGLAIERKAKKNPTK